MFFDEYMTIGFILKECQETIQKSKRLTWDDFVRQKNKYTDFVLSLKSISLDVMSIYEHKKEKYPEIDWRKIKSFNRVMSDICCLNEDVNENDQVVVWNLLNYFIPELKEELLRIKE